MNLPSSFDVNNLHISCRPCEKGDRDFVLNLYKTTIFLNIAEFFEPSIEMFDTQFNSDYAKRVILTLDTERIGVYQLTSMDQTLDITGLFLTESTRGRGIAKYLLNSFELNARETGKTTLRLEVWRNNSAANFYKHMGFDIHETKGHKYIMTKAVSEKQKH